MHKNILIIGGTRFFGKQLVRRLLADGHRVTIATRGRNPDDFGDAVQRLRVDRRDEQAMQAVFAHASYDLVFDQMCYSPLDAAIALEVFAGKVGRYVMSSTIETYRHLVGRVLRPLREDDLDLTQVAIDWQYPWRDPALADVSYAAGKLQAEAVLMQDGRLPVATLRIAHVLSAQDDFTGRLASYVQQVMQEQTLLHLAGAGNTSFLNVAAVVDAMVWAGMADFLGPLNLACQGNLSAPQLVQRIARLLGKPAILQIAGDNTAHSPFDYAHDYVMDTARARGLGYQFSNVDAWLDRLILDLHQQLLLEGQGGATCLNYPRSLVSYWPPVWSLSYPDRRLCWWPGRPDSQAGALS
ncbi:NAD-dependent epimerase/dehydratase family protein [Undibacterium sp. CY18W]|uniref:UDP-glucose 4-epimerase n=1 Tax=Undibacterium hunanense TaxID=2762292 RepID=A0ABR6ZY88_9BURK|nr:NAD-dependent epimerase/dehydratase family protein [Undibacterium hunanense]MBC3920852.1 NAD-dependent epimerase/dehydratase family protein [Undibacterium hunanense]